MSAPVIKEAEAWDRTSCTLPRRVWERVEKNLERVNASRPKPEKYSRDRLMAEMLDWACRELEREAAAKGNKKAAG